jgi:glycosyltransferase involved in cell wall biosynthesis
VFRTERAGYHSFQVALQRTDPAADASAAGAGDIFPSEVEAAIELLRSARVAVFIVAYNAEAHLESVVARIPAALRPLLAEIFVIDDSSTDATFPVASRLAERFPEARIRAYRTPDNRGYGGNQKLGYLYCIERSYDFVVLLHGDGQYAPEYLPRLLAAFGPDTDAVFASRMLRKRDALAGGMPAYKWIGNQLLTAFENRLLKTRLSEFHTGFRAYRVSSLRGVPFAFNNDGFHFDTEIIVQAVAAGWRIREVAIPTHYGDEICHVNGLQYAFNCAKAAVGYRLVQKGLFYKRNYDLAPGKDNYHFKKSGHSLHQFLLSHGRFEPDMATVELGANRGLLSAEVAERVREHVAVDLDRPEEAGRSLALALDLDCDFVRRLPHPSYDACIALDVIEHLDDPEAFLEKVFALLKPGGTLYISTANVAYALVRMSLLAGQFNYGRRGILDMTHKRLFTVGGFRRLLRQFGFRVEQARGFPPPLTDEVSRSPFMRLLERCHAALSERLPRLFAFNVLMVARRLESVEEVFGMTVGPGSFEELGRSGRSPGVQRPGAGDREPRPPASADR